MVYQVVRFLVHTYNRAIFIILTCINSQNIFHCCYKCAVVFRWNTPICFKMRFQLCFLTGCLHSCAKYYHSIATQHIFPLKGVMSTGRNLRVRDYTPMLLCVLLLHLLFLQVPGDFLVSYVVKTLLRYWLLENLSSRCSLSDGLLLLSLLSPLASGLFCLLLCQDKVLFLLDLQPLHCVLLSGKNAQALLLPLLLVLSSLGFSEVLQKV